MKYSLPFILFISYSIILFGQGDIAYWDLIQSRIRSSEHTGTIYYSNKLPMKVVGLPFGMINQSSIANMNKANQTTDYLLTRSECEFVKSEIRKAGNDILPDSIFTDAVRVDRDSIVAIVEAINKSIRDSVMQLPSSHYPKENISKWAYFFSNPIYLRNKTLLVYFFMYFRQSSGASGYYVSKIENGHWSKGIIIAGGDW